MFKKLLLFVIFMSLCGCVSQNIEVKTTRQWEGHYMTVQQFHANTSNIELKEGESIWVLCNDTLYGILKKNKDTSK